MIDIGLWKTRYENVRYCGWAISGGDPFTKALHLQLRLNEYRDTDTLLETHPGSHQGHQ